ncbi:MAG: tRNA glutamyl-Q(34) synthetase GluQRS [Slackia sp.]
MTDARPVKGRFAPSPTGRMHAGNIFAALMAWLVAKSQGGTVVLRIEDLDKERSKPHFIDAVQRDFEALGLFWDEGPYFQHDRDEAYQAAFDELCGRGLVYPCFCTRADLHAASAPHHGEKLVYPGTCRRLSEAQKAKRRQTRPPAYRLIVPDEDFSFRDEIQGEYTQNLERDCGDFLIRRSDGAFAYQLAVVVDDAEQGITSVVRGVDLLCSTPQQIYLQTLLGAEHPAYAHVPLIVANTIDAFPSASRCRARCVAGALQNPRGDHRPYSGHDGHRPRLQPRDARRASCRFRHRARIGNAGRSRADPLESMRPEPMHARISHSHARRRRAHFTGAPAFFFLWRGCMAKTQPRLSPTT